MDWNVVESNWQQYRDDVRANWRRLSVDHLDTIAGERARLATMIEATYSVTRDEAERQIKSFEARQEHVHRVSFR